ncbi:MAG: hypothetical protein CMN00_08575 [Rickettsiales bacterium]|nr:hypothetical protein [Rickettsiales bacterium]
MKIQTGSFGLELPPSYWLFLGATYAPRCKFACVFGKAGFVCVVVAAKECDTRVWTASTKLK